jgi:diaminopimelate decarboxylase
MKANPLAAILRLLSEQGVHIDASSGYEAWRAMRAGISAEHIMITSQQLPNDLNALVEQGVRFNATSLHQLETYGRLFPNTEVSIRLNPGVGSGATAKVSTGGPSSSFGIWQGDLAQAIAIAQKHRLTITKLHTHIGSGNDPAVWQAAAHITLEFVGKLPDVTTINLGGGFKAARMATETASDLSVIGPSIGQIITEFAQRTGRRLHLEIEPGTFLVANAGTLLTRVQDATATGTDGFRFLKLDAGLTEIMRPSLYAAQHPIVVINDRPARVRDYIVVGHTCESGDLLTPAPHHPDAPLPRPLQEARIGDLVAIEGVGAYCSAMSAIGYNSFPTPNEVLLGTGGQVRLIKRAQDLVSLTAAEVL